MARTARRDSSSPTKTFVLQMSPANSAALSAATGQGVEAFRRALFELCPPAPAPEHGGDGLADFLVYRPAAGSRPFKILRTDRGFRVTGRVPEDEELEAALRGAGAKTGDEVEVEGEVLELD